MFIGHLPAGYLLAKVTKSKAFLFWGIVVGSILPDLDMVWFLFVDGGSTHHHEYITHRPLAWLLLLLMGLMVSQPLLLGVGVGGLFHMVLDSIAGRIDWGWPFFSWPITLVDVPASQSHWVLSFLLHWTFLIEICIVLAATLVLRRRTK